MRDMQTAGHALVTPSCGQIQTYSFDRLHGQYRNASEDPSGAWPGLGLCCRLPDGGRQFFSHCFSMAWISSMISGEGYIRSGSSMRAREKLSAMASSGSIT